MISSTLGAPLGGTTVGGQNGFDCSALKLITPPTFGGGGGRYFPSMVVVALGEPGACSTCADGTALSGCFMSSSNAQFGLLDFSPSSRLRIRRRRPYGYLGAVPRGYAALLDCHFSIWGS